MLDGCTMIALVLMMFPFVAVVAAFWVTVIDEMRWRG